MDAEDQALAVRRDRLHFSMRWKITGRFTCAGVSHMQFIEG
jgi:hypothetical protein